jgi:protein TonB
MNFPATRIFSSLDACGARFSASVQWGWLIVVAGAHAAGLVALDGLGGAVPAVPAATDAPAVTVRLIAPEAAPPAELAQQRVASPVLEPRPVRRHIRKDPTPRPLGQARRAARPPVAMGPAESSAPAQATARDASPPRDVSETPLRPAEPSSTPSESAHPDAAGVVAEIASLAQTGNDVMQPGSPARLDAAYLHNPTPSYPQVSRRRGEEGLVVLRVRVLGDGRAGELEVAESSGHRRLDNAALETVRKWRFIPARRGEATMASWLRVPIAFRLED